MYAPELNIEISGWVVGVDMELDGQYHDGSTVYDTLVIRELERIGG